MTAASMLFVVMPVLGAPTTPVVDPVGKERQALAGTWVIQSASWCGCPTTLPNKDKTAERPIAWSFEGNSFKAFVGGAEPEEGRFELDTGQSPKHLDLVPPKDSQLGARKCLYALDGDELTIAISLWFAPGSPEEEAKQAARMRSTRPATLGGMKEDLILVLTLKRQKK